MADIFSDAYQFGRDYGLDQSDIMKQVVSEYARKRAASLVPRFFQDYREYRYTKSAADLAFSIIYLGIVDAYADRLKAYAHDKFSELKARSVAEGIAGQFMGKQEPVPRLRLGGSAEQQLALNYTVSTGIEPDGYVKSQLQKIVMHGDAVARKHGATWKNINWESLDLHLQPGMKNIPPELMQEIYEELDELFTEPSMREIQHKSEATLIDKYGIMQVWNGGTTVNMYYRNKEIGMYSLQHAPLDSREALTMMEFTASSPDYPEMYVTDEKIYNMFRSKKK